MPGLASLLAPLAIGVGAATPFDSGAPDPEAAVPSEPRTASVPAPIDNPNSSNAASPRCDAMCVMSRVSKRPDVTRSQGRTGITFFSVGRLAARFCTAAP